MENECPYPIKGDSGTAKDCIEKGHCACDEKDEIMRLDTKPGEKVRFLDKNGLDCQLKRAKKLFKKGDILIVKEMNIGGFSSTITFISTGGEVFNTVMFENVG